MTTGRPRVLVIPASYFAVDRTIGGGERYALEYARALARLAPTTLGLFDLQDSAKQDGDLTVRTFSVRSFKQRRGFPVTCRTWEEWQAFDVIHAMVFPTPLTDLLALATRWNRQTFVLTDVGGGGTCWSGYLQKLHPRLNLNRLADGLASLSEYGAGFFADWSQPKLVLHGGADLEKFRPTVAAGNEPPYALFVGRLLPHKGVLEIIEAIGPQTPLHVVGRPYHAEYVAALQKAAMGKQVTFVFDADDAELQRQYAGAGVVLQPSLPSPTGHEDKSELLGLVAIEAMACGKPVIVTRTTSLPELVLDEETGFIIEPHDRTALRERIERLLSQPALAARMGRVARLHVERHFTWERTAQRGLDFYRELREHQH